MTAKVICLVLAIVCFVLKASKRFEDNVDFMNLGFAFVTASLLV